MNIIFFSSTVATTKVDPVEVVVVVLETAEAALEWVVVVEMTKMKAGIKRENVQHIALFGEHILCYVTIDVDLC